MDRQVNKRIAFAILIPLLACCQTTFARDDLQNYKKEIRAVVESFRVSIINKDKATFLSLFYKENIPWIVVFSDEMVAQRRLKKPSFPRSVDFSKFDGGVNKMISDTAEQEEKIWNLKIETDGYLGSVHFDYSDHHNGYKRAWGTEAWDLVRNDDGWKIISVIYTVTENPVPKAESKVSKKASN
jgi:hypothetical protein